MSDSITDLSGTLDGLDRFRESLPPGVLEETARWMAEIRRQTGETSREFIENFNRRAIYPLRPLIESTAHAVESLFRGLVDGSARSGRAFAAILLDAVGRFASAMGEAMIATAKALQALMTLNIPATFTAGFALIAIGASLQAFAAGLGGGASAGAAPAPPPELPAEERERRLPMELTVNLVNNGGVLGLDNVRTFIVDAVRDAVGEDRLAIVTGPSGVRVY